MRPIDRQLEPWTGARGQIEKPQELDVLVAADVREALDRPAHDGRVAVALRRLVRPPQRGHDRLPRLLPAEVSRRHGAPVGPDVRSEREQMGEPAEELHVPLVVLRDGQLRKRGIGINEDAPRDARVLIAPEPASAGKIDEDIRLIANAQPIFARVSMIFSGVIDVAPVDVARVIARVVLTHLVKFHPTALKGAMVSAGQNLIDEALLPRERVTVEQLADEIAVVRGGQWASRHRYGAVGARSPRPR